MKTPLDWNDPDVRRDALVVVGLLALGFLVQITLGVIVVWLLEQLGWWDIVVAPMISSRKSTV